MFATARYGLDEIKLPGQCFTCKQHSTSESSIRHQGSHLYLDNPPMQNYRSKSETAIIVAGCLKYHRFQFFSPLQSSHFGFLSFFTVSLGFFRCFVGVFRRFNTGKHVQRQKNTKLAHRQKQMSPAIIPEKAIILHTLEDVLWQKCYNDNGLCLQTQICICSQWLLRRQNPHCFTTL